MGGSTPTWPQRKKIGVTDEAKRMSVKLGQTVDRLRPTAREGRPERVKTPEPKQNASKAILRCVPGDTYTLPAWYGVKESFDVVVREEVHRQGGVFTPDAKN